MDYLIHGGTLVNEGKETAASLYICNGRIKRIYLSEPEAFEECADAEKIDASGCYVLPGIIDDHVHFREPGLCHKADIYTESRAAVAGGVTSFMDMPNTIPPCLSVENLEEKFAIAAKTSLANYSFYIGCSENNLEDVLSLDPTKVCGAKVFLGSSTGGLLLQNKEVIENIFCKTKLIVAAHCEDEGIMSQNAAKIKAEYQNKEVPFEVHPKIRSSEACYNSSSMICALAKKHGAKLHILHITTKEELELLDEANGISGEVCVNHLWFSQEDYAEKKGLIKCNPAIKSKEDREALRKAVAQLGLVVGTDHAPHTLSEKNTDYFSCPSGCPSIGESLIAMFELSQMGYFSICDIVDSMCHKPAKLFNIKERGFLKEGFWADICILKPNVEEYTKTPLYKCGWSPYQDVKFTSKPIYTFVNGNLVYQNGKFHDENLGKRLEFER